jgi:hypothetical protein
VRFRPQISRAYLEANRRRSFAVGAAELADEFGIWAITVTMLCQVGHSARNTFYELFSSADDCLRFTAARGYELLFAQAPDPADQADPHEIISALCEAASAEPALVRFLLLHSRGVKMGEGDRSVESATQKLAGLLASGRKADTSGPREDFVAGIYIETLTRRLLAEDIPGVADLAAELDPWALPLLGSGLD